MPEPVQRFLARARMYVLHYVYAMIASSFNAGIATVVATTGIAAAATVEPGTITPLAMAQVWAAFKYGAIINAIYYLWKNPLPEKLPLPGMQTGAPFSP